jgi:hypothetical protein
MTSATATHLLVPEATRLAQLQFCSLEQWLSSAPTLQLPLHLVEQQQEHKGRELQRLLLQAHVQLRGTGDAGPALRVFEGSSSSIYTHRRIQRSTFKTIFGSIEIDRTATAANASGLHPWMNRCNCPPDRFPTNSRNAWSWRLSRDLSVNPPNEFWSPPG